jgi:DNA-binding transcriptional LysR family regulator
LKIHGLTIKDSNIKSVFIFALAVKAGSFSALQNSIGMPKSKISRHVSSLEDELGEILINRSTRRFEPTEKAIAISEAILSLESKSASNAAAFSRGYKNGEKDGRLKGLSEAVTVISDYASKEK